MEGLEDQEVSSNSSSAVARSEGEEALVTSGRSFWEELERIGFPARGVPASSSIIGY